MFGKTGYQVHRGIEGNLAFVNNAITNISNVNSIGYKKGQVSFVEMLDGEVAKHESKEFSQGPLRKTDEPYDLALEGPGFFEVELPNGQRAYTRAGRLRLTGEGELVTEEGHRIVPEIEQTGQPVIEASDSEDSELGLNIKISTPKLIIPSDLTPEISLDGTVNGISQTTGEKSKIGKISVVLFNNPQGLESIGKSCYLATKSSGMPIETKIGPDSPTSVKQGYVEFGNVDMVSELVNLSQMKNLLSAQFKLLKTLDKIYENVHYTISKSA